MSLNTINWQNFLLQNTHCHLQFQNNKERAQKDIELGKGKPLRLFSWPKRFLGRNPEHLWRSGPFKALVQTWSPDLEATYPSPMKRKRLWCLPGLAHSPLRPESLANQETACAITNLFGCFQEHLPLVEKINPQGTSGKDTVLWTERTAQLDD